MKTDKKIFASRESEVRSYCRNFDKVFSSAYGTFLFDEDGNEYFDFLSGCSTLNYGHNDKDMKAALVEHISNDGIAHGLDMYTTQKAQFIETFERLILEPRGMNHKIMMTGPTGTNAVEAAVKLARKVTGRRNIVAFTNAFHGMTMGSLALTGNASKRGGAGPVSFSDVAHLPYDGALGGGELEVARAMLDNTSSGVDAPAAFIVETVQGEGGLNAASQEWLQGIQQLAKQHGALLIVDDIQAGVGRTGNFFSFDYMGVQPDIITLAKSLSGYGLPFAMVLLDSKLDIWKPAEHNGTFRGNTHAFVTARVALEKFWSDDKFARMVRGKGEILGKRLEEIADLIPGAQVKGRDMMKGIDVGSGELAERICARCFEKGLIIETSGADDEVVKVLAPLTITYPSLYDGLDIVEQSVLEILNEK